ncbi:MAG TPA: asparagine synthase (glutamine-hydrolyzing) [Verrucomicrobiae bacterium]|nr:asparagine synthase (glutamine-hydrolyzing) [Verrucomicrobiae bacterium]
MCGIAGQFGPVSRKRVVAQLINAIGHRGPDQAAHFLEGHSYVGASCRLAITERHNGIQPCTSVDGNVTVSLNGEIYNYLGLRKVLLERGAQLRDNTECELLIAAYQLSGPSAFDLLEGMFAIALYDASVPRLFLVRDPMGIKPLYFTNHGSSIAYSSEQKSFFAAGLVSSEIDEVYGVHRSVFGFGPVGRTLFSEIRSVEPGTYLEVTTESTRVHHMALTAAASGTPLHDLEEVRDLVIGAIRIQVPAEVPWGVLLSGGVDSSIIATCAVKRVGAAGRLFTIKDEVETADLVAARTVADSLQQPLVECVVPKASSQLLYEYLVAREEYDLLSLYTFVFCRSISGSVKAALCGQGADELFAGYTFHRDVDAAIATFALRWEGLCSRASRMAAEVIDETLERLQSGERRRAFYQFFLREQLIWFQLDPLDKCSMAHGLEVRIPYLDHRLVRFISALPVDAIFEGEKHLLREAFRGLGIPTLDRPKQFAGRWTIPRLHHDILNVCRRLGGSAVSNSYRYAWMVEDIAEAVCLEALLILMGQCAGGIPAATDIADMENLIRSRLSSSRS